MENTNEAQEEKDIVGNPMLVDLPTNGYVETGEGGLAFYLVVKSKWQPKNGRKEDRCVCIPGSGAIWQAPDVCLTRGYYNEAQVDAFLLIGSTKKALRWNRFSGKYFCASYSDLTDEGKVLFDILKKLYGEVDIVTLLDT